MNPLLIALVPIVLAFGLMLFIGLRLLTRRQDRVSLANIAEGTHGAGIFTFRTDAAHSLRYLLLKRGTDDAHVAIAGASDTPLYVGLDEAGAAEEPIACQALACSNGTIKLVSDGTGALAAGDVIVPAASGKAKKIAAGAGNYYVVGIAVATVAATDGEIFEAIPVGSWKTQ